MARIFFTSDLHGSESLFNKLMDVPRFYNAKNIVVGGDLTGKALVPIVKEGNIYKLELFGEQKKIKENELEEIEREIRNAGEYYRVMESGEYSKLLEDRKEMARVFLEEIVSSLDSFLDKVEERLKQNGAKLYLILGNYDSEEVAEFLEKRASENVVYFDMKVVEVEGYEFLGYGYSNPTPWHTPREKDEKDIYLDLKKLAEKVDAERSVFVIHPPPINTKIDKAPKLDTELKQVIGSGYTQTISVGSVSVRKIIEEYAPIAGLHGHIHEANGIDFIRAKNGKEVPVLNPGSSYSSGVLNGVIAEFENNKLEKYYFTKG